MQEHKIKYIVKEPSWRLIENLIKLPLSVKAFLIENFAATLKCAPQAALNIFLPRLK